MQQTSDDKLWSPRLQAFQGFLMVMPGKSFKNDWKCSWITVCYQRFFACIFIYFYPQAKTFVKFGLHASVAVPNNHPLEDFLEDLIINPSLPGNCLVVHTSWSVTAADHMDPQFFVYLMFFVVFFVVPISCCVFLCNICVLKTFGDCWF